MHLVPQERVLNRTPEQLVDDQCLRSLGNRGEACEQKGALEAVRRFCEQKAVEEEEEEDQDDEEEEISRVPPHFRPHLWCRFMLTGSTCPHGVAHSHTMSLSSTHIHGSAIWRWVTSC